MLSQDSLLVTLVQLVDRLPTPALPENRGCGDPKGSPDRLFLKALVIMIVRHLHTVHEFLCVLAQPTTEMTMLRHLLTEQECFPSCRTWERQMSAIPATLPAQTGCLGRHLVSLTNPGPPGGERWSSIAQCCPLLAAACLKNTGSRGEFPQPPFEPKPTGPNPASKASC